MSDLSKVSGYANYPTFSVALWIDNDEKMYNYFRAVASDTGSKEEISTMIQDYIHEKQDSSGVSEELNDILSWALEFVDWNEVAERFFD